MKYFILFLLSLVVLAGCSTYSPGMPPVSPRGINMGDIVTTPSGSSFNPASPGPIGATTPSTVNSTGFSCATNNVNCLTQADSGATQRGIAQLTSGNILFLGAGTNQVNVDGVANTASSVSITSNNTPVMNLGSAQVSVLGGATLQSTGGAVPTITCSGGSAGTAVAAGSTNNRGNVTTSSSASTNCTITWSAAGTWAQAPFCLFNDSSASITPVNFSTGACGTSTCVFDFASATSKTVDYICM